MSIWDELDESFNNRLTDKTRTKVKNNNKYCPKCKTTKTVNDFYVSKKISPISYKPAKVYQPYCIPCTKIYLAKLRDKE